MEYVLRYLKLPSVKSLKTIMKSLCYQALGILLFLALSQDTYAQDLRLSADVDNTTPDAGEVFNYIINASCSNSTSDCESVVITDPLHPVLELISVSNPPDGVSAIVYDDITHELTITLPPALEDRPRTPRSGPVLGWNHL